jgi:hypothetical protein
MNSKLSPPVQDFFPAAFLLAIAGWGGLVYLIRTTLPTLAPRWMFFFLVVLAISGIFLPLIASLNRRFPSSPPAKHMAVMREASMLGIFVSTLAWLQLGRVLTPALVLLLALGIGFVEWLIRLREASRWEPKNANRNE